MLQDILDTAGPASNVVSLNARQHRLSEDERLARHASLFARDRRAQGDVLWLKENAELLNILECTHQRSASLLAVYEEDYDQLERKLAQFPQYYRFLLSMALDLEDLGLPGMHAERMCAWAARQNLADAELSDLQRAEAHRLLSRRLGGSVPADLRVRLISFASRAETFAMPNRKAAYELTHIVFYLSEYGRQDPDLPEDVITSLNHTGLLAFLDQNFDLLAEVCVALRYAGRVPSAIWEEAVLAALRSAVVTQGADPHNSTDDGYHAYFVTSWLAATLENPAFQLVLSAGAARIDLDPPRARPLMVMAQAVLEGVSPNWHSARKHVMKVVDEDSRRVLEAAEASSQTFGTFFRIFARGRSLD